MIENEDVTKLSGEHSKSTGNLAKTSVQYKSNSSLAVQGNLIYLNILTRW